MRYDSLFERHVERSLAQAEVDLRFFVESAIAQKIPPAVLRERIMDDLFGDGPIFGKFMRGITNAGNHAVMEARRQGTKVTQATRVASARRLLSLRHLDVDKIIEDGDPGQLEEIEDLVAPLVESMWVAELLNTCYRCLPLHGIIRTEEEWKESGKDPATIHGDWSQPCHCYKVIVSDVTRGEVVAPLKRVPLKKAGGSRRTERAITQIDLEKSLAAVEKARNSLEGRRTMRLLGRANENKENT